MTITDKNDPMQKQTKDNMNRPPQQPETDAQNKVRPGTGGGAGQGQPQGQAQGKTQGDAKAGQGQSGQGQRDERNQGGTDPGRK